MSKPLTAEELTELRRGIDRIFREYVPTGEEKTIARLLATLDAHPEAPTREDVEWLVWYARKQNGTVADVAQRALDENPGLRPGGWRSEAKPASSGNEPPQSTPAREQTVSEPLTELRGAQVIPASDKGDYWEARITRPTTDERTVIAVWSWKWAKDTAEEATALAERIAAILAAEKDGGSNVYDDPARWGERFDEEPAP